MKGYVRKRDKETIQKRMKIIVLQSSTELHSNRKYENAAMMKFKKLQIKNKIYKRTFSPPNFFF